MNIRRSERPFWTLKQDTIYTNFFGENCDDVTACVECPFVLVYNSVVCLREIEYSIFLKNISNNVVHIIITATQKNYAFSLLNYIEMGNEHD